jgi:hypothetical protein
MFREELNKRQGIGLTKSQNCFEKISNKNSQKFFEREESKAQGGKVLWIA